MGTTLAWLGDPAAETYTRELIARLSTTPGESNSHRRAATANLDLALTLLLTDRPDEACDAAQQAIQSGRIVPSNYWRAAEIVAAIEHRQLPEAQDLRTAYEDLRTRAEP